VDFEVGANDLAELFDVTPQRIGQLVKEGMPKVGHGKYDLRECIRWRIDKSEMQARAGSELEKHKIKEIIARTKRTNVDIAIKQSKLILYEDAKQLLESLASQVVAEINQIASRVQTDNQNKQLIIDESKNTQRRIAQYASQQAELLQDMGTVGAAATAATESDS